MKKNNFKMPNLGKSFSNTSAIKFIREAIAEVKKTVWPSKKETIRLTLLVILLSFSISLLLGGTNYLFRLIIEKLISL